MTIKNILDQLSNSSVLEFRPAGTVIGTLSASEAGTGHTFTYSLPAVQSPYNNSAFAINGNALQTADAFDSHAASTQTIEVQVKDELGNTQLDPITIQITPDANLTVSGQTLTIPGTSGSDVFSFVPGAVTDKFTLNGTNYAADVALINKIVFQGGTGNETAYVSGLSTGTNTLALNPTGGSLSGTGYTLSLKNVGTVQAHGNPGDVAYLYDSSGQDAFAATPVYDYFEGSKFYDQEVGFGTVNAFAASGTNDSAYLYDAGGNNVFVGTPTYAYLTNSVYFDQAVGFKSVNAFATGTSNDAAYLFDNGGTNTFVGTATASSLQGTGYFNQAVGFSSVFATAGQGANDSAYLSGAAQGNVFTSNTAYSYMYGPGYLNEALGFKTVSATGAAGDTASLYDGPGTNTYSAQGAGGNLSVGSLVEAETGFGFVNIVQSLGSSDTVVNNGITFTLNKVGNWH